MNKTAVFFISSALAMGLVLTLGLVPKAASATQACSGGNCWYIACDASSDCGTNHFTGAQTCRSNSVWQGYITYTCNNPGSANASCTSAIVSQQVQTCGTNQACSYGICQSQPQPTTTASQTSSSTTAPASSCTSQSSRQCISNSNIAYWFNSCGALESVAQNCNNTNQVCQSGQCVNKAPTTINHYTKSCYQNALYWYDSKGALRDLAQNCQDKNSCTLDSCGGNKCANELKCDGSTCAANSPDYIAYCSGSTPNQNNQTQNSALVVSNFVKKDDASTDWTKNIQAANDDKINFLIVVKNTSSQPLNTVLVKNDIANTIEYTGNLKINDLLSAGNIGSGVDVGTIAPQTSKAITFSATVHAQNTQITTQIAASASSSALYNSDVVTIAIAPLDSSAATGAISNTAVADFARKWYIWGIIAVILVVLFIVIFRRLSTNV